MSLDAEERENEKYRKWRKKYDYVSVPEPSPEFDLDEVSASHPIGLEISRIMGKLDPDGTKISSGIGANSVQEAWERVSKSQYLDVTKRVYVKGSELVVVVTNPVYAAELRFLSDHFSAEMNKELNTNKIKEVSFRTGN
ncbi:MAG: DUF721 domain-containing protein [Coriobacteriia bacterium]|nr:DUF721 domain-containing protein [Coriobacteriia bacterium]